MSAAEMTQKRTAHVKALRQCCERIESLLAQRGQREEAVSLREELDQRNEQYMDAHSEAVALKSNPDAYKKTHEDMLQRHKEYALLLDDYIEDCLVESRNSATKSTAGEGSAKSKSATRSVRTRTSQSKRTTYVSMTSSVRLAEVRVQEKLERKRLAQLKQIQAMQQQKKDLEDAIAIAEQTHKVDNFAEEARLLEQEEIRRELGSDYESDEEDEADREDVTQRSTISTTADTNLVAARGKEVPRSSPRPVATTIPTADDQLVNELLHRIDELIRAPPSAGTNGPSPPQVPKTANTQIGHNPPESQTLWSERVGAQVVPPQTVLGRQRLAQMDGPTDTASGQSSVTRKRSTGQETGMEMIGRTMMQNNALTPCPIQFDGDPADYLTFMAHYRLNVEPHVSDAGKRLSWLITNVTGEARELIHTCMWTEFEAGLKEALTLLKENYGEDFMIADTYIESLINGGKIKQYDADAIINLSNEMRNCSRLLNGLNYASNLDTPAAVRMIAKRLPDDLELKWAGKSAHFIKELKRQPNFDDLRQFVQKQADKVNTPYVKQFYAEKRGELPRHLRESTLVTTATSNTCAYCERTGHHIAQCYQFKTISVAEREEAARSRHLCFRCLGTGHNRKDCRGKCGTCRKKHHTLLHDSNFVRKPPDIQ